MSKLTFHLQSFPPWFDDFTVEYVKIIDPPEQDPFPGTEKLVRFFMPDNESNDLIWLGGEGAERWFAWLLPKCRARPWIRIVEGPNEPQPMADSWFRAALDVFTVRLVELFNEAGLKLIGHNWAVGWPDVGDSWQFGNSLNALAAGGHYLGLHEYSAPSMRNNASWLTLRHRKTFAELRSHGIFVPKTIIGECGIDGGVIGQPKQGWQTYTDEEGYLDDLIWFDTEIKKDPEIVCATIFTVCDWDWQSFNITESLGLDLADYIWLDDEPEPVPMQEPGIDVSQWQGAIDWQQVAASGIKFAMIRASVCRADGTIARDACFVENWTGAKAAGLKRGAYHYLHQNGLGQAAYFASTVGPDAPELGYWADVEDASLTADKVQGFLDAMLRNVGEVCGVYTRASFFDKWGTPDWAGKQPLWVAHWGADSPTLPKAWNTWRYWQYSNMGNVPGISGRVDLDWSAPFEEEEPVTEGLKFFNRDGTEMTEAAFRAIYGQFRVEPPAGSKYRLVELWDSGDSVGMDFQCYVRPSYPAGARLVILNGGKAYGSVKAPDMQEGAVWNCYAPPDIGAYTVTIEASEPADRFVGAGWLCETGHRHIQKYVYQYSDVEPPEPPEPPSGRPYYFHKDGSPMLYSEVVTMFGEQVIYRPGPEHYPLYEIAELHWSDGVFLSPRVLDQNGNPVAGVEVFLKNNRTNEVIRLKTNAQGYVSFDVSGASWGYNVPAETGCCSCGLVAGSQVHDSSGRVNDKVPRVLNPVFKWTSGEPPATTYKLTVNIVGQGIVTVSPLQESYLPDTVVKLTAIPAEGWRFVEWATDLASSSVNPVDTIMNRNKVVTATFESTEPPDDDVMRLINEAQAEIALARADIARMQENAASASAHLDLADAKLKQAEALL